MAAIAAVAVAAAARTVGQSTLRPTADARWRAEMNYRHFWVLTATRCYSY